MINSGYSKRISFSIILKVINHIKRQKIKSTEKIHLSYLFSSISTGHKNLENWSIYELLLGLSINYPKSEQHFILELENRGFLVKEQNIFDGKTNIFLDGNFHMSKTEIKEKLKIKGLKVVTILKEADLCILGKRPKLFECYPFEITAATESFLYQYLKDITSDDQYLLSADIRESNELNDNLIELLKALDPDSVSLGLEIAESGGVSEQILEPLLWVSKTNENSNNRRKAKKLLAKNGPTEWAGLLDDRQLFTNISTAKERELRKKMIKLEKSCGQAAVEDFSLSMFRNFGKGLSVLLRRKAKDAGRLRALELLVEGETLDFHKAVGYKKWGDQEEEIILSFSNETFALPVDYPKPLTIKKIILHNSKFKVLSSRINVFKNLEYLDCSANHLKTLPGSLADLNKLKYLDLSFNKITEFPEILYDMKQLETLILKGNNTEIFKSSGQVREELVIPEDLQERLTHCKIVI